MRAQIYQHKDGTRFLGIKLLDGTIDYTIIDIIISLFDKTESVDLKPISEEFEMEG